MHLPSISSSFNVIQSIRIINKLLISENILLNCPQGHLAGGMTVMSIGLEPHEEKVQNANFPNWFFFTDD